MNQIELDVVEHLKKENFDDVCKKIRNSKEAIYDKIAIVLSTDFISSLQKLQIKYVEYLIKFYKWYKDTRGEEHLEVEVEHIEIEENIEVEEYQEVSNPFFKRHLGADAFDHLESHPEAVDMRGLESLLRKYEQKK
jgi:hypothetical protein